MRLPSPLMWAAGSGRLPEPNAFGRWLPRAWWAWHASRDAGISPAGICRAVVARHRAARRIAQGRLA